MQEELGTKHLDKRWVGIGAASAAVSVALGAFGAHGLRERLSEEMLAVFRTGVDYQMWHSLGLILLGLIGRTRWPAVLMLIGILVFSGSLYALSLTGVRWFAAITPIGGVCLILAWCMLAWSTLGSERE
jgi:uncharacterized membrane protein YgdD (TMEM256/DUF423 family)